MSDLLQKGGTSTTREHYLSETHYIAKLARRSVLPNHKRLAVRWKDQLRPMLAGRNIRYQVAGRARVVGCGGIGAIHLLGLPRRPGSRRSTATRGRLCRHPLHRESDHVLSSAYNVLAGGTRIEHWSRPRSDEAYLDALGARAAFLTPPPPATSGRCWRMSNRC